MSVADKARKAVQDLTGMWWPDADEGGLRDVARAWRAFADDVDDITPITNKAARQLIQDNKGESIHAFDTFWRRCYDYGPGWLKDLADAARDMAKALDKARSRRRRNRHRPGTVGRSQWSRTRRSSSCACSAPVLPSRCPYRVRGASDAGRGVLG
ncbi:WXG100-like domain-containing protein [Streptomyces sp. NPDC001759]